MIFLFGLGLILLELAFESPMKELYNTQDKQRGPEHADYLAARRLKPIIGTPLGSQVRQKRKKVSWLRI